MTRKPDAPIPLPAPDHVMAVKAALWALADALDDDRNVPARYTSTIAGELADVDSRTLRQASSILGRLSLWMRYPLLHDGTYLVAPAASGDGDPDRQSGRV